MELSDWKYIIGFIAILGVLNTAAHWNDDATHYGSAGDEQVFP